MAVSESRFRELCLSFDGASAAPHFDRTAFRRRVIFATLAEDGLTANIMLLPEEQEIRCASSPGAFRPVPNKWGENGATTVELARVDEDDLMGALTLAANRAAQKPRGKR